MNCLFRVLFIGLGLSLSLSTSALSLSPSITSDSLSLENQADSLNLACYMDSIDFSRHYLNYLLHPDYPDWKESIDMTEELKGFKIDFGQIFSTVKDEEEDIQNGIFGVNCYRLQMFVSDYYQQVNPREFHITGADKRGEQVYFFSGTLQIDHLLQYKYNTENSDNPQYVLVGHYRIVEEESTPGSGSFCGTFGIYVKVDVQYTFLDDKLNRRITLDDNAAVSDGYGNRNFVGTWTSHFTHTTLKAIWADNRIPYSFDFDCGAGEMTPCDKYIANGWESFVAGDEYKEVKDSEGNITGYERKNKWWR